MDKSEIEKILTEYVNEKGIQEMNIIIDKLWKEKSVKLIER